MKLLQWCKANAMPVIAVLAAAVTAVFVPPDSAYLGYYDVKTLSCLLCVLAVVGALRSVGLFPLLAQKLVQVFHTTRGAVTALVGITLVGSMLLTNDTALLTFLPLSWFVLERTGQTKWTALTFILQNCAANLGGMLTPFRQPPEPVSVQPLQHPQRGVPVHHAAAVPAVHGADPAVLSVFAP